jgi:hypothetical protein
VVGAAIEENPDAENEHAAHERDACFNQTHTRNRTLFTEYAGRADCLTMANKAFSLCSRGPS